MTLTGYSDYYHGTLEKHRIAVKLVPDGTGLGKTNGNREVVQAQGYQQNKFISA
jgi:hypothetical protein